MTLPTLDQNRLSTPVVTGAGLLLTWVVATALVSGDRLLPTLVVAGPAGLLLLRYTREAALLFVLLTATLLPSRILPLSAGAVRTDAAELLGFALLGAVAFRACLGEGFRRSAFLGPLAAIAGAATFGVLVAVGAGAGRESWLAPYKTYLLYLLPLAFCWLFADPDARDRLEQWIQRIATWGCVLVLTAAAVGLGVPEGEVREVVTLGAASEALRLRPALLNLVVLATLLLAARTAVLGLRRVDVLRFSLYAALVAASFTRSTWVPLVLCLALLTLLRPGPRVPLRGVRTGLVLTAVSAGLFIAASAGALGATAEAITVRISSIGSDQVLTENSYRDREVESELAWQAISREPVTGVGLGQPYGAVRVTFDEFRNTRVASERRFIHNSYLGVWLGLGAVGVAAFAWLGVSVARAAVRAAREQTSRVGARCVAAGLAMLALGLQASFQTSLGSRSVLATVCCALALLDVPPRETT